MSKNELVSVIIPVYNVNYYLDKCVKSVIEQDYKDIEIILVDDGSTDGCAEKCDKFKKVDRRIVVVHKKNGGLSDARNSGLRFANGKYIVFIDGDDYVEENYISKLYSLLKEGAADISVTSHFILFQDKKIRRYDKMDDFVDEPKVVLDKLLYDEGVDLSAWGKMYKKELFDGISYPVGRLFEDSATTYKLIDRCRRIAVSCTPTYNYVMRNNSIANKRFSKEKFDLILSTKEMTDYIVDRYPSLANGCRRRLMYAYLSTLSQLAKSSKYDKNSKEKLMSYIRKNRRGVLKDKRLPKRDRIALKCSCLGFWFYRFCWRIYEKKNKGAI